MSILLSVVIITRNRCASVIECIESIQAQDYPNTEVLVIDNASSDDTCTTLQTRFPDIRLLMQATNTGVPGGRNIGIREAKGEICVCIDDDAIFLSPTSISSIAPYFERDAGLAALALRIVDQYGNIITKLIPRRDRKVINADTPGANFSGTGFAVRRDVFIALGGFWEKLNPYFGEEPDYCYRLLDAGYHILHTPFVSLRHYESPYERPKARRLYYGARNAPWMALRSLPWPAVFSLITLTWGYFFLVALKEAQLKDFAKALRDSLRGMPEIMRIRKPISRTACATLRKYSGLFFY